MKIKYSILKLNSSLLIYKCHHISVIAQVEINRKSKLALHDRLKGFQLKVLLWL